MLGLHNSHHNPLLIRLHQPQKGNTATVISLSIFVSGGGNVLNTAAWQQNPLPIDRSIDWCFRDPSQCAVNVTCHYRFK